MARKKREKKSNYRKLNASFMLKRERDAAKTEWNKSHWNQVCFKRIVCSKNNPESLREEELVQCSKIL